MAGRSVEDLLADLLGEDEDDQVIICCVTGHTTD